MGFSYLILKFPYYTSEPIVQRCCGSYWYRVLKVTVCDDDDDDDDGDDK